MCESHACARCGEALPQQHGRGRPRKYCAQCKGPAPARSCQYCGNKVSRLSRYPTCADCAAERRRDRERRRGKGLTHDPTQPQTCIECGQAFFGRKRKLCGAAECKRAHNARHQRLVRAGWSDDERERRREYDRARGNRSQRRKSRTCEVCESLYAPTYGDQRTCSRECGTDLRRREGTAGGIQLTGQSSAVHWKRCTVCMEQFIARRRNTTRCDTCRPLPRIPPISPTARTCPECGISFLAKGRRVFCTTRCAKASVRRLGKERRKGRIQEGDRTHRFGWRRLAKRQGLDCHICGEPCDPNADPCKDDWAPTVDHVIPISQGGTHTFDNARIAHRYCNSIRGAASVEEARGWLAA